MVYVIVKTKPNTLYFDVKIEQHQKDTEEEFIMYIRNFIYSTSEYQAVKKALEENEVFILWVLSKFNKLTITKIFGEDTL